MKPLRGRSSVCGSSSRLALANAVYTGQAFTRIYFNLLKIMSHLYKFTYIKANVLFRSMPGVRIHTMLGMWDS